jgi:hypothetical protein
LSNPGAHSDPLFVEAGLKVGFYIKALSLAIALSVVPPAVAAAQTGSSTVAGMVRDESGGAIRGDTNREARTKKSERL